MAIDWTDSTSQVSTYFTVKDCLHLSQWNRLANDSDGLNDDIKHNLINLCAVMEGVRAFLGNRPIVVHCMYRPEEYNKLIGGAPNSSHKLGMAIDFNVSGLSDNKGCDSIRAVLLPKLKEFKIRMEDISDKSVRSWIHIDTSNPHPNNYFRP